MLSRRRDEAHDAPWMTGYPLDGDARACLAYISQLSIAAGPAGSSPFGYYQMLEDGVVVGGIGFHGPPQANVVEVGYGVAPDSERSRSGDASPGLPARCGGRTGRRTASDRPNRGNQRGLATGHAGGRHAIRAGAIRSSCTTRSISTRDGRRRGRGRPAVRIARPEFTGARDRMATDVRRAGDRDLAAAIKKLRRPTASAWFANQLVRHYGHQVAELLDTGAALRRAQADLDVDELRHQTQAGQQLITELARQARQVAADTGQSLSDDNVRELEETLHAGLVDPAASDAIRAGRLTTPLRYSGFGLVEGADAAPPAAAPARPGTAPATPGTAPARPGPPPAAARPRTARKSRPPVRLDRTPRRNWWRPGATRASRPGGPSRPGSTRRCCVSASGAWKTNWSSYEPRSPRPATPSSRPPGPSGRRGSGRTRRRSTRGASAESVALRAKDAHLGQPVPSGGSGI